MVKPASFDGKGMKKGAWSEEEDEKLRAYVMRYGHWNWRLLPKYAGLARCGKSCRLRWVNYLKPGVKKGKFTKEEEELIVKLQKELGNKWSTMAAKFPGRTDSEIKNYWYRRIEKRCNKRNPSTKTISHKNNNQDQISEPMSDIEKQTKITHRTDTNQMEQSHSPNGIENHQDSSIGSIQEPQLEFWLDVSSFPEDIAAYTFQNENPPSYRELHYDELSTAESSFLSSTLDWMAVDDQAMVSSGSVSDPVQDNCWTESFALDDFMNNSKNEGNYYDPLFQYFDDHGAYTGCYRYEEYREDLRAYNECTLI